jgi:hypothetical protein
MTTKKTPNPKPSEFAQCCDALRKASARVSKYSIEERAALSESIRVDKVSRHANKHAEVRSN